VSRFDQSANSKKKKLARGKRKNIIEILEFSFYQQKIQSVDNGRPLFRIKAILPQQAFDGCRGGPEKVRQVLEE
jgi:hypothetical protein